MSSKSSKYPIVSFEESEQDDSFMQGIFDEIGDVPDKEPVLEIPVDKSYQKKKQASTNNTLLIPDQELDLHGKTLEEAIMIVQNFLITCHAKQLQTGLIITGKGLNSGNQGPVLKKGVEHWLKRNGNHYLRNFYEAPNRFGGSGAIWLNFK